MLQLVIDIPEYVELLNAAGEANTAAAGSINRAVEDLLLNGRKHGFETMVRLDQPPTSIPSDRWSCSTDVDSVITYGRHLPMGSGHFKGGPSAVLVCLPANKIKSGGLCCRCNGALILKEPRLFADGAFKGTPLNPTVYIHAVAFKCMGLYSSQYDYTGSIF